MTAPLADACVLNTGPEAWVFAEHAARMAAALGAAVREALFFVTMPRRCGYRRRMLAIFFPLASSSISLSR